jgi:hypothetical protein
MGSPVSVALAEITMQFVEENVLSESPCHILFWKRYVDDVHTAIPKDKAEILLNHLNCFNENIQFTMEKENNDWIPYLDLLLKRQPDGGLNFSIYQKSTNSGRYLDFFSYHPLS